MKLKKPELILTIVGVLLLLAAVFAYLHHHQEGGEEAGNYPAKKHGGPCPGETKTLTQHDVYMRGVIEQGQKFKVVMNYYDCNPVKKGDIVLYSLSQNLEPVVKIVRGVAGDHFSLSRDKKYKAWNLLINGEMVMNETDHAPYFFGGEMPATLSLYEKSHKGVLHNDEVILLSSWAPGDSDSGMFGVFNLVDVLGKVEVDDSGKSEESKSEAKTEAAPEGTSGAKAEAPAKAEAHAIEGGTPVKTKSKPKPTPKAKKAS